VLAAPRDEEGSPRRDPCTAGIDDDQFLQLAQHLVRHHADGLDEALVKQDVANDDLPAGVSARPDRRVLCKSALVFASRPSEQHRTRVRE
jgi:hypothetical protein